MKRFGAGCRWQVSIAATLTLMMLSVATSGAGADAGSNSAAAKLCQKGGWEGLETFAGESFGGQGDCVAHAARGGVLVPKRVAALVFDIGPCSSILPDYEPGTFAPLNCPDASLVGSGLLPHSQVTMCEDGNCFLPLMTVTADGTLPNLVHFDCHDGVTYTFQATTAVGDSIVSAGQLCSV